MLEESLRLRLVDLSTALRDARTLMQWIRESRPGTPRLDGDPEVETAPVQHRGPRIALYSRLAGR